MKAKEYLRQLYRLEVVIKQKMKEKEELYYLLRGISGIDYSREKVQASRPNEAYFAKILEKASGLDEEINSEIDKFIDLKHLIIKQIQSMDEHNYIELLYKRYVEFKDFSTIADEMNYSDRQIFRLHGMALKAFEKRWHTMSYKYML